jgi:plasmid stabilization system protein ParE
MVQVVWAEPALADLKEIYQFIARDSPRYAQITVEKITRTAARLRTLWASSTQVGTCRHSLKTVSWGL